MTPADKRKWCINLISMQIENMSDERVEILMFIAATLAARNIGVESKGCRLAAFRALTDIIAEDLKP